MRNWYSFYEILKFPLEILLFAVVLAGTGNLLTNPNLFYSGYITNQYVLMIGEIILRTGNFLITNFPLLFLIRLSARKGGSATSVSSAIAGYVGFLIATMYFAPQNLAATAYSSILGLSVGTSRVPGFGPEVRYPLQTGIFAALIVAFVTLGAFNRSRNRSEYGFFGFISKEASVTIRSVIFCTAAGILMAFIWPFLLSGVTRVVNFIASDTTNPINLALYGIGDRFLGSLNLGTLIRQPFWYTVSGGSWMNLAGTSVTGDVPIWTSQLAANALTGISGRFFTPYYVLNIFAVPGMIWGMFSMCTDAIERRKKRWLCILATAASLLSGTLLPLELMLLLLCPLLYVFHLAYTGVLYALLHGMHIYLGFRSSEALTLTAMPGTLPEFLTYMEYPTLNHTLVQIAVIGVISMVIYFVVTRVYFKYLAVDLFNTGSKDRIVKETIRAFGGIENVKMIQSSVSVLTVSVYDPNLVRPERLRKLGSYRLYETRAGYNICFGAASTMIRRGIGAAMRESVRTVNE